MRNAIPASEGRNGEATVCRPLSANRDHKREAHAAARNNARRPEGMQANQKLTLENNPFPGK